MNWEHVEESSSSKDCFWINIQDDKGRTIAEVKGAHYDVPNNECRSNAKLIASAPDMLSALQYIAKVLGPLCMSQDTPEGTAYHEAIAAIKKAK